jgi:hypothetical protein
LIALSGRCVVAQVYKIVNLLDWLGQIELPRYWRHSIWPFKDALQHSYYSLLIQTKKSKLIEQKAKEMAKDAEKKAYEAEQLKRQLSEARKKQEEDLKRLQSISSVPTSHYQDDDDDKPEGGTTDLSMEGVTNVGSELERVTLQEKDKNMAERLHVSYPL